MRNYLILKFFSKCIYFVGSGNFWHEEPSRDDNSIIYKLFSRTLFMIYGSVTLLEILAALIGDFPKDEKSDSITFAVSHTIVMMKIFSVISNKDLVKKLIRDLVRVCELHEEDSLMAEKYSIMKINVVAYFIIVYGSAACFVFEGLRKMYAGSHFVTVVTYYPAYADDSMLAIITRILTTIVLLVMLLTMIISVDCFTLANLIIFKYKFISLRNYFEQLRKDCDKLLDTGNYRIATEKLAQGLKEGIIMHGKLIKIAKDIDKAFGTVLALQLCQSSGSAVSLLLQIALSDNLTLVARMKILFFVIALFFLLGLFLCNTGDITYQASRLSDAIFYCGWHLCSLSSPRQMRRKVGQLVLLACAQSNRAIVMKAFNMLELTYGTFLLVVRGTYSVFALFYAQNQ